MGRAECASTLQTISSATHSTPLFGLWRRAFVKCIRNQPARAAYNLCNAQMHNPQDRNGFGVAVAVLRRQRAHIQHVLRVCSVERPIRRYCVSTPKCESVDNAPSSPALLLYNVHSNWNFGGQQHQKHAINIGLPGIGSE